MCFIPVLWYLLYVAQMTVVTVLVEAANGDRKRISAQRLLLAVEPSAGNLDPFGLDARESAVFSKFRCSNVYAGAVRNPSLVANQSLTNMPATAELSNWTALTLSPFNSRLDYFSWDSDLFRSLMVGDADLDADGARSFVADRFNKMVENGVLADNDQPLQFAAFEDHGPMHMHVDTDDIKAGFVQAQYALQGHRSTWWTGAAFSAQPTTVLWAFNDLLLPTMVENVEIH
ncbi:putative fad dependent oxidoreductase superfamily [Diaporthe ampelina]|uniref:Putative fad dependent oxidoreductase superfamily n=1 Tax=Diaporthe ampelina TaxID=1214573 RepID=A0A0G2F3U5_9PEZI|nr:putative fad dependent oxidoreductase superfamily [Diaporthe ampelina]